MSENLFSERLKEKMKERSLRQIDLLKAAEKSGIKLGKSHISQYVSGKTVPRENIINFLAEVLDTDPEWLKGNDKSDTAVIKRRSRRSAASAGGNRRRREAAPAGLDNPRAGRTRRTRGPCRRGRRPVWCSYPDRCRLPGTRP